MVCTFFEINCLASCHWLMSCFISWSYLYHRILYYTILYYTISPLVSGSDCATQNTYSSSRGEIRTAFSYRWSGNATFLQAACVSCCHAILKPSHYNICCCLTKSKANTTQLKVYIIIYDHHLQFNSRAIVFLPDDRWIEIGAAIL